MKKLKATLAAVLALCMCLSMSGCGNSGEKTEADIEHELETINEDNWEEKLIELDESMKAEKEGENSTGGADAETITPTDEILSADIYSSKFQINNTVITFPATAAQLQEAGVTFNRDIEATTVQADESQQVEITANGEKAIVYFRNETTEAQFLKDCIIDTTPFRKELFLPKGITAGTPIDELISKWGEPTVNNLDEYIYIEDDMSFALKNKDLHESATGNMYSLFLDLETNTVKMTGTIYCQLETDEMIEMFNENDKVSYKIPDALDDNYMIYTYNDKDYLLEKTGKSHFLFKNVGRMKISELSDAAIKEYYDKKVADDEHYSYTYKFIDSGAVLIERNCNSEGSEWVKLFYIDSEVCGYETNFVIRQPKEEGWYLPDEAVEAADDILFAIGETVKPLS